VPLLTKADLVARYDDICRPTRFPQAILYTSGTEGRELLVPVSAEEIAAAERLLGPATTLVPGDRPLAMTLVRVGHGGQLFSADAPSIPAHIQYGPDQLLSLLRRRYDFPGVEPRISTLEGNLLTHIKLIDMLRARGIDGRDLGIELVLTTGWYVTPHKRRTIEAFWGATLLDRYGVTEVNGDAKQCPGCGGFHFDPFVIAEAIDPSSGAAVTRGTGSLILTGLFPFNQVAPKIRYALGDLVSVDPAPACGLAEPAYRFLGRAAHSLFRAERGGTRYILFPTEVADVIDDYPQVVRRSETGFLCFASTWTDDAVRTRIEWRGDGDPAEIAARIVSRSPTLAQAIADGVCGFDVEFVPPGSLATISKL
jgi:phenylacetate-coenzyme A ligase PaaK-like adenylate-forming protein